MHDKSFWLLTAVSALVSAVGCEFWAAFVHRVLWHGPLWPMHKSHHRGPKDVAPRAAAKSFWEANDLFGIVHALGAMLLVIWGLRPDASMVRAICVGLGAGLTCYGLAYGLVHDAMIHQRLWCVQPGRGYWRRVFGAHQAHHRHGKAPYGLFLAPFARRRRKVP